MLGFLRRLIRTFVPEFRKSFLEKKIMLHRSSQLVYGEKITFGEYIYIGPNCFLNAQGGIRIGTGSILAPEVVILSSSHDYKTGDLLPYDIFDVNREVIIGSGVWIGYRAMICPGVVIGDGAVVAMGAVVTRNVEVGAIVGGNPAQVISQRRNDLNSMIEKDRFFIKQYFECIPKERIIS